MSDTLDASTPTSSGEQIPRRSLNTAKIVALIIAALTPLTVVVGTLPLGLAFGGPSAALMFLVAGGIVGLFCIGYAQMVRRINRPGAFYNYIARGIGRPAGVGAAGLAVVGYPLGLIGAYAAGAYTINATLDSLGVSFGFVWSFIAMALVIGGLLWRRIDVSAVVSGVIVALELVLIFALLITIVANHGAAAFDPVVLSPSVFHYGDWAVALIFAILVFQGFEAGAMYAPEANRPEKTIPRALYIALAVLTGTFFVTSWMITSLPGVSGISDAVEEQGIIGYVIYIVSKYLGHTGLVIFSVTVVLAVVICTLDVNNFMSRYLYGLAKDDLLPAAFARTNKHGAPAVAAFTLLGIAVVTVLGSLLIGIDPYVQLTPICFGLGALTSTALQLMASASVIGFFRRRPVADQHWWKTFVAPAAATLLLLGALVAELSGFGYITGVEAAWTNLLPIVALAAVALGVFFGFWLRRNRPHVYEGIAQGDTPEEAARLRELRRLQITTSLAPAGKETN